MVFQRLSGFLDRLTVVITDQRYRPDDMSVGSDDISPVFGHLKRFHSYRLVSRPGEPSDYLRLIIREQVAIYGITRLQETEETNMPVLLLWAVPAVIVIGGAGYWLVHLH